MEKTRVRYNAGDIFCFIFSELNKEFNMNQSFKMLILLC